MNIFVVDNIHICRIGIVNQSFAYTKKVKFLRSQNLEVKLCRSTRLHTYSSACLNSYHIPFIVNDIVNIIIIVISITIFSTHYASDARHFSKSRTHSLTSNKTPNNHLLQSTVAQLYSWSPIFSASFATRRLCLVLSRVEIINMPALNTHENVHTIINQKTGAYLPSRLTYTCTQIIIRSGEKTNNASTVQRPHAALRRRSIWFLRWRRYGFATTIKFHLYIMRGPLINTHTHTNISCHHRSYII